MKCINKKEKVDKKGYKKRERLGKRIGEFNGRNISSIRKKTSLHFLVTPK
jgi:hypothetical protein